MKKILLRSLLIGLLIGLALGINYLYQALPIISGYGAKNLCSCVFVAGRSAEEVIAQDLGSASPMLALGSYAVQWEDSSAVGSVFGLAKRKAIYRKGLGCTLVAGISEDELRAQQFQLTKAPLINQDTLAWPMGNVLSDSLPSGIHLEQLKTVLAQAFINDNPERPKNTRAVVVLYKGQLVAEQYAEGFTAATPLIAWSMTKSVTNALWGIVVKDLGFDIYAPAPVDEWRTDVRSAITIDHLLRASSGLDWEENYGGPADATNMLYKTADMGAFASKSKVRNQPDSEFYYSSGTTNILSWIMRLQLGTNYQAFPYQALFYKIGMFSAMMEPDASGTFVGSSYMYATARDYARFGLLFAQNGNWNGEQLLPENWVSYTITPAPAAPQGEYGAQWWLNAGAANNPTDRLLPDVPTDCYFADGFEGQRIFVIPSKQLVVVRLGLTKSGNFDHNDFLKSIIETVVEEAD